MVKTAYLGLVIAVALQRLLETRLSRSNERELIARGGVEHAAWQMPIMVALHTGWLVACVLEGALRDQPPPAVVTFFALFLFCGGQALRLSAIHALDERWTVKVMTVPGAPAISGGVFRYLRHPNYLGVILEIAALPLVFGGWPTAIVFSVWNGLLLHSRIRAEESALAKGSDYGDHFRDRPRLVPKLTQVRAGEQA